MQDEIYERLERRKQKLKEVRKKHIIAYEKELAEAKEKGRSVVWSTSLMPVEILKTMDLFLYYPELECGNSSVDGQMGYFCEEAEKIGGFSRDVCSFIKGAIGGMYKGERARGRFLPQPDLVIGEGTQCDAFNKGWEIVSRHYEVPLFRLDGPYYFKDPIQNHELEWGISEIKRMITFLETHTKTRFDWDKFKEIMKLSTQVFDIIVEILEYRKSVPQPVSIFDSMRHWSHLVLHLGTEASMEYWPIVLEDVRERVEHGVGVVENERFRLWYDQVPLYHMLDYFDYLRKRGAAISYEANWLGFILGMYLNGHRYDPEKPLETLALKHFYGHLNTGLPGQIQRAIQIVKEWRIDGAIIPANTTCKLYSQSVLEKSRILREACGIPSLLFDIDCFDERDTDKNKILRDTDQFLEILASEKTERGGQV